MIFKILIVVLMFILSILPIVISDIKKDNNIKILNKEIATYDTISKSIMIISLLVSTIFAFITIQYNVEQLYLYVLICYVILMIGVYNIGSYRELKSNLFGISKDRTIKIYLNIIDYNIITENNDKILRFYKIGVYILPVIIIVSLASFLWFSFNQTVIYTYNFNNIYYIIISTPILLIIHEFGHLITMSADDDLNPSKIGIIFYYIIPIGMYVKDDVKELVSYTVVSAGIFNNILLIPIIYLLYVITASQLFYVMLLINISLILVNSYPALYTDGGVFLTFISSEREYIILIVTIIMIITALSLIVNIQTPAFFIHGFILLYICSQLLRAYFD